MKKRHFMLPVAVHLFFFKNEHILLLRRYNTGFSDGQYSVVAGHIDGGETIKQAAIREAKEEAGAEIKEADIEIIGVMHRKSDEERIDFFAVVHHWEGTIQNMEPHKCDELSFYPLSGLPNNMIPYVRKAIHNYHKGTWFESFGWLGE